MEIEHKKTSELSKELEDAKSKIEIGSRYSHYKDASNTYVVEGLGFLESTNELCVIYQAEYGDNLVFLRPLSVWLEEVSWEGESVPRFTQIQNIE